MDRAPGGRARRPRGRLLALLGVGVALALGIGAIAGLFSAFRGGGPPPVDGVRADRPRGRSAQIAFRPGPGDPPPLIDPDEVIPGGPPPDGIPPIDEPKFVPAAEAEFLAAREPVLALEVNGDARAYPLRIMIWHEIVNDEVGGVPVAVTYCPLCNTGIAYRRPVVEGRLLDFGTSGMLYRSNLVMYDRQTGSLWPQVLGQAAIGPLTGTELEFLPVQVLAFADWRAAHADGLVLSTDTGVSRPYGVNPYEGYDDPLSAPFLFAGDLDPRLPPKERVLAVVVGGEQVAIPYRAFRERAVAGWSVVELRLAGTPVVAFWKEGTLSALDAGRIPESRDVGATGAFSPVVEGRRLTFVVGPEGITDRETGSRWSILGVAEEGPLAGTRLERVLAVEHFWFDWAAFFPGGRVFGE